MFVLVFQNVVTAINSLLKVIIPDEPGSLRLRKRQHAFVTNELIIKHELESHHQRIIQPIDEPEPPPSPLNLPDRLQY